MILLVHMIICRSTASSLSRGPGHGVQVHRKVPSRIRYFPEVFCGILKLGDSETPLLNAALL